MRIASPPLLMMATRTDKEARLKDFITQQKYPSARAELDILHQAALAGAAYHEEIQRLNDNLRRDKERLAGERDRKIAQIRSKQSS